MWKMLAAHRFAVSFLLGSALTWMSVQALSASKDYCQRRTFLHDGGIAFGSALFTSTAAATLLVYAEEVTPARPQQLAPSDRGGKPYAPLEALLPAARLRLWVEDAYLLSTSLAGTDDKDEQYKILQRMNNVLSNCPKLFTSRAPTRTNRPTAQLSTGISSANREQYKSIRTDLSIPDKMAAMLNQADVERQWGMLQYAESKREQSNDMRAAFNYYTQSLTFGDTYQLTASKEDKKRMIRNDELPSLTAVIVSDLDLRDLYRNQFLTAIEDAKAEVAYQVRKLPNEVDRTDAVELIGDAYLACKKWFDLIAPIDVEEAMEVVRSQ